MVSILSLRMDSSKEVMLFTTFSVTKKVLLANVLGELAKELMEKAKQKGVKFMLPVDTKVGKEFDPNFHEAVINILPLF